MSAPATHVAAEVAPIVNSLLCFIPLCPLIGAAVVYLFTRKWQAFSGWVASLAAFVSFLVTVQLFRGLPAESGSSITAHAWHWIQAGSFSADLAFRMDHLSAVMTLVVTGVGTLIHLYAIGYMAEDESRARFFTYLNLFLCAMLLLVLGDNLLVMFVGWEGVGLCSYLLIGFWHKEMPNADAGQKAFVVNRIGDAGFLLGLFTLFITTGSVNFTEIQQAVGSLPPGTLEFIAFTLFIGAMGKSAQVPLYVWLPDAMAGPTPVSALIHAATMVTAGVYMIARLGVVFAAAPMASTFIGVIGAVTAILAASIALVQTDIKKVLAYSTVSQLGYMFMAMGAGAFSNGIFHVVTHAFFKALLFMAAGSVIMGTHHEQDMREFGGLRKYMPVTFFTYLIATLAIAGVPLLSGFYSKDAILWSVFSEENPAARIHLFGAVGLNHVLWGVGFITAGLTAFYMTRSLVMTFFGSYRGHAHPHESPLVVVVPLVLLAVPSAIFGKVFGPSLMEYLAPWTRADLLHHPHSGLYLTLEYASIAIATLGIAGAAYLYGSKVEVPRALAQRFPALYRNLLNKWWVDEAYAAVIVRPLAALSGFLFRGIDRSVIDASVNGTAILVETEGRATSSAHTGQIGHYLVTMFIGMIFLTVFWLLLG